MEDVPELIQHFIGRFSAEEGKNISSVTPEALDMIQKYPWPGNVRQLENAIYRAVVLADQAALSVNEFPQIAAHVEGFEAMMPVAPAPVDDTPKIDGPAMIGVDSSVPITVSLSGEGRDELGIPALDQSGNVRALRSEERRLGNECLRPCRSRGSPDH